LDKKSVPSPGFRGKRKKFLQKEEGTMLYHLEGELKGCV